MRNISPMGTAWVLSRGLAAGMVVFVSLHAAVGAGSFSKGAEPQAPADLWDPVQTRHLRNPFLPPGYRLPSGADRTAPGVGDQESLLQEGATDAEWTRARARLVVRGISQMDAGIAVIMGDRIVSSGDIVAVEHEGRQYRWRIVHLDLQHGIQLERLSATYPGEPIPTKEDLP